MKLTDTNGATCAHLERVRRPVQYRLFASTVVSRIPTVWAFLFVVVRQRTRSPCIYRPAPPAHRRPEGPRPPGYVLQRPPPRATCVRLPGTASGSHPHRTRRARAIDRVGAR